MVEPSNHSRGERDRDEVDIVSKSDVQYERDGSWGIMKQYGLLTRTDSNHITIQRGAVIRY